MKTLSYVLAVFGVLFALYAVVGRFVGSCGISFLGHGPLISSAAGLILANTILIVAALLVLYSKK